MISQLIGKIKKTNAPICVGLDPMLSHVPEHVVKKSFDACGKTLEGVADVIWQFNKEIIDHACDLVPVIKLQTAIYEQSDIRGLIAHKKTVEYCHEKGLTVVGDAKWGDIDSTPAVYAIGYLGTVQVGSNAYRGLDVDMLMVSSYLGTDGAKPLVDVYNTDGKGLSVLVKTPNPSNGEFQGRLIDGKPSYKWVTQKMTEWGTVSMGGTYSNVRAVVDATCPEVSRILHKPMPAAYFLVLGYGAQGDTTNGLKHCFNEDGFGAIVSSSRGVITTYKRDKYRQFGPEYLGEASRQAILDMIAGINSVL